MRRFALISVGLIVCTLSVTADDATAQIVTGYSWIDPSGGNYNDPFNWENLLGGSGVPDSPNESARFNLDAMYTVDFMSDVTAAAASVTDGSVRLDLDAGDPGDLNRIYTLDSLTIDGNGGGEPRLTIVGGSVIAESTLFVRSGTLTILEPSGRLDSFADTVVVEDNGQIIILGDNFIDASDPRFSVNGDLLIDGGTINKANSGRISFTGQVTVQNGGNFTHDGPLFFGTTGSATLTLTVDGAGSTFDQPSGASGILVGQASNGSATINIQNGGSFSTGGNQFVEDVVSATGQINVMSGGTFSSNTPQLVIDGNVTLMDGVVNANGITLEGGGVFDFLGGTLHVDSFNGNLLNQGGTLAPGHSIGTTSVSGSYAQQPTAALQFEIGGILPDQWDVLTVEGNVFVDGTLHVALVDNFQPVIGNSFTIVSTLIGNVGGQFDTELLPVSNGLTFDVVYNPKSIVLQVIEAAALLGDYNQNGTVDAADYIVWRKNEGTTNMLPNDPLGGTIGPAHYNQWRAHFGQSAVGAASRASQGPGATGSASAAVPEPHTIAVLLTAGVLLRRRPRQIDAPRI